MEYQAALDRWLDRACDDPDLAAELNAVKDDPDAVADRFYRDLEFGTGGLRGVIGAGSNRMNIYTVRRAAQGLADYLHAAGLPKKAAIAHDSRIKGGLFARETARVLAANGITACLYPRLAPTPALSWAVRYLGCGAGVCVTASHNPAAYNGYKVYGPDGGQITPRAADEILACMEKTDCFDGVRLAGYDAALAGGRIRMIGEDCLDAFLDAVLALRPEPCAEGGHKAAGACLPAHPGLFAEGGPRPQTGGIGRLRLVYTPLNGAGLECVQRLLARMGLPEENLTVVPSQKEPDGNFPTCPSPNPEVEEAMAEGLRLCETIRPDLLLGTDPDCDRMGAAVPDGQGGYRLLTGNEIAVLLFDWLCRTRLANGSMPANPVAVTTIVSTDMAAPIAAKYGVELRRTLTGFKYIGEQISLLEAGGRAEDFLFGFEESFGYLSGGHVRDKDAVNAVMLICECAAWYAGQGKTLLDALNALYEKYGWYRTELHGGSFAGESGMRRMQARMAALRKAPPAVLGGFAVEEAADYAAAPDPADRADMLEYRMAGGGRLTVRPSGTEPRLKLYLSARGGSAAEADARMAALRADALALLED